MVRVQYLIFLLSISPPKTAKISLCILFEAGLSFWCQSAPHVCPPALFVCLCWKQPGSEAARLLAFTEEEFTGRRVPPFPPEGHRDQLHRFSNIQLSDTNYLNYKYVVNVCSMYARDIWLIFFGFDFTVYISLKLLKIGLDIIAAEGQTVINFLKFACSLFF